MYLTGGGEASKQRFEAVKALIAWYAPGQRFLEVGCAEGVYCEYAIAQGAALVVGTDVSRNKIGRCRRGVSNAVYIVNDWEELPFEKNQFDIALLTECIEHARYPQKLVDDVMQVADTLIMILPLEPRLAEDPLGHKGSGHLHTFSEEDAKDLFRKYEIERWENNKSYIIGVVKHK